MEVVDVTDRLLEDLGLKRGGEFGIKVLLLESADGRAGTGMSLAAVSSPPGSHPGIRMAAPVDYFERGKGATRPC